MPTIKIYEQHKEWAIKAAVGIAAMILFYTIMVAPVFQNVVEMRQGVVDAKRRADFCRELENLNKNLNEKETVLATITERSQILGRVSDIAEKAKVHITTLTPRTEPNAGYVRLRMEMEGQGSFFSLLKFLQGVERTQTALRVKDVSTLVPPTAMAPDDQNSLRLQLGFETLLKQSVKKNNG
jgi:hypothetical protein